MLKESIEQKARDHHQYLQRLTVVAAADKGKACQAAFCFVRRLVKRALQPLPSSLADWTLQKVFHVSVEESFEICRRRIGTKKDRLVRPSEPAPNRSFCFVWSLARRCSNAAHSAPPPGRRRSIAPPAESTAAGTSPVPAGRCAARFGASWLLRIDRQKDVQVVLLPECRVAAVGSPPPAISFLAAPQPARPGVCCLQS